MGLDPVDRAIGFLCGRQAAPGQWETFETLAGPGTEWISAYVGLALASLGSAAGTRMAEAALSSLAAAPGRTDGWGYNDNVPADADSTSLVLLLDDALGALLPQPRRQAALAFLEQHVHRSGALATFAHDGPIRTFTTLAPDVSFAGWCGEHGCVTATAAAISDFRCSADARAWLRSSQRDDGSWLAYWWVDDVYASALAVEALRRQEDPGDRDRVAAAGRWAAARMLPTGAVPTAILPHGAAFSTALTLRLLANAGDRGAAVRARDWILAEQGADGGWLPSAELRIPPPFMNDPHGYAGWVRGGGGGGSIILDRSGVFTTATVVHALAVADACD